MKNLVDCRYFLNSVCLMGNKCPYRHNERAKGTHIVCPRFEERRCFSITCGFRHTVDKENIPCFFENRPGGCRRHNCVFQHSKKNNFKGNSKSLDFKIKTLKEIKNEKKSNQGKRKSMILLPLEKKEKNCKQIAVSDLCLEKKNKKYAVKDRQPFIDCSKVLVSPTTPAILDTVNNATLTSNSASLNCNLNENKSTDGDKVPVSNCVVETNQHTHVSLPVSLTSDEDEINSCKKVKPENFHGSMLDEFEGLLDYEDMDIEETETTPDEDFLLEVDHFLNS